MTRQTSNEGWIQSSWWTRSHRRIKTSAKWLCIHHWLESCDKVDQDICTNCSIIEMTMNLNKNLLTFYQIVHFWCLAGGSGQLISSSFGGSSSQTGGGSTRGGGPSGSSNLQPLKSSFFVSFMVDARGGAMTGGRGSGLRLIIPPVSSSLRMELHWKKIFTVSSSPR